MILSAATAIEAIRRLDLAPRFESAGWRRGEIFVGWIPPALPGGEARALERHRLIVKMIEVQGQSLADVAETLGISKARVGQLYRSARESRHLRPRRFHEGQT